MTDDDRMNDDPAPDDELASAYLDGAADEVGRARVASDPGLLARVKQLGQVQRTLAEPPAIDPAARDRAISAALAAWDADGIRPVADDARVTAAPASVTPLASRRRPVGLLVALGAAAALVLVAILGVSVTRRTTTSDLAATAAPSTAPRASERSAAPSTTARPDSAAAAKSAQPSSPVAPGAAAGGSTAANEASAGYLGDLGAVATPAELRRAVTVRQTDRAPTGGTSPAAADAPAPPDDDLARCLATLRTSGGVTGPVTATATATLAGQPVLVVVTGSGPATVVTAVRPAGCAVVATVR